MNKAEMLERLHAIGTCEDDVQRRTLITEITDEIGNVYDSNETLTASNRQFESDNETLRNANLKLFLKVGGNEKVTTIDKTGEEPEKPQLKYENLFNEKGELK